MSMATHTLMTYESSLDTAAGLLPLFGPPALVVRLGLGPGLGPGPRLGPVLGLGPELGAVARYRSPDLGKPT